MPDNSSYHLPVDMKCFETYLASQQSMPNKKIPYYLHWVSQFYTHCNKMPEQLVSDAEIKRYFWNLGQRKEEWQVDQAHWNTNIQMLVKNGSGNGFFHLKSYQLIQGPRLFVATISTPTIFKGR